MKSLGAVRAVVGMLLCGAGFWVALRSPYREQPYIINVDGCAMATDVVEKPGEMPRGFVVLFHGISANKKIMSYVARSFAEQGLRVYATDFPGHGRTPGPFSPAHAEQCGEALVRELLTRHAIIADRTIVAGHSMGGAVAVRVAAHVPVAGVIAISPAPMRPAHGVSPEKLLYQYPPILPPHSLVMIGSLELRSMRGNAEDLVASNKDGTVKFMEIPGATHVSILFKSAGMKAAQEWVAQVLNLPPTQALPSHRSLVAALTGFIGIVMIVGPFLRETVGSVAKKRSASASQAAQVSLPRLFLEFAVGAMLAVCVLQFWVPIKSIRIFQGDYLANFLLLLGAALSAVHWNAIRRAFPPSYRSVLAAAFAGIVLLLLTTAWFDLTFSEAWLTSWKWARFPLLFAVVLPYHLAEEALLGPVPTTKQWRRLALALSLRLVTWLALMFGVVFLHDGKILLGLLALYMGVFNLLQRSAMDIVRHETDSAAATAIFGAILQTGFCLVVFPIT